MANVANLEITCLKIVMDLGLVINSEILPASLVKKIEEIKAINGKYYTQDNMDEISCIDISYDGETICVTFKIYGSFHKVSFVKQMAIPVNKALLYFIELDQDAVMKVDIFFKENVAIVQLGSEDSQWKWVLSLEIR